MKNIVCFLFISVLVVLSFGCQTKTKKEFSQQITDDSNYVVWADTIIYDVLIHNPDSLDEWQAQKIKNLKHEKMVNDIFESVYTGKKTAYNYYTNKTMSVNEIKELENSYQRKDIGKLQFSEIWLFNEKEAHVEKQIYSILVAYVLYDDSNKIRGYKAAFYIEN